MKDGLLQLIDGFLRLIDGFLKFLVREKTVVTFNDLNQNKPVSSVYGLERGTAIDRYYIERFLRQNAHCIRGKILEVGDSFYSRKFAGKNVDSFDVLHALPDNKKATVIGDLTDTATLPENAFDCFICTQTFNFIFDVQKAIHGANYLLKPGGVLLATVAGISQISRYDMDRWGDYWRFTTASAEKLFAAAFGTGVGIESHGNVLAATAFLQGLAVEDLPNQRLLDDQDPDYQLLITIVARKEIHGSHGVQDQKSAG